MGYATAADIISKAAVLLGLPAQATPYTSTDATVVQLCGLLAAAGADLVREYEWSHLRTETTVATVAGQSTYTLPADYLRFINQTAWNRTSRLPIGGPTSPQEWQALKALNVVGAVSYVFRTKGANLLLLPTPASVQSVAFEYMSSYWVDANADGTGDANAPTADAQVVLLDSQMMIHRLRRDFQDAKGFDSSAASNAYDKALALAMSGSEPSPVLRVGRGPVDARLLDGSNVPTTGFGS